MKKGIFPDYTCTEQVHRSLPRKVTVCTLKLQATRTSKTQNRWGSSICPDPLPLFVNSVFWVTDIIHQCLCWKQNSIKCLLIGIAQTWKDTSDDVCATLYLGGKCYQQRGQCSRLAGMILLTWNNQTQKQIAKYTKTLLSRGQLRVKARSYFPWVWGRWGWTTAQYCCLEGLFQVLRHMQTPG